MKTFKVIFKHSDGDIRIIEIEAFDLVRARLRFLVNWGDEMEIIDINEL